MMAVNNRLNRTKREIGWLFAEGAAASAVCSVLGTALAAVAIGSGISVDGGSPTQSDIGINNECSKPPQNNCLAKKPRSDAKLSSSCRSVASSPTLRASWSRATRASSLRNAFANVHSSVGKNLSDRSAYLAIQAFSSINSIRHRASRFAETARPWIRSQTGETSRQAEPGTASSASPTLELLSGASLSNVGL